MKCEKWKIFIKSLEETKNIQRSLAKNPVRKVRYNPENIVKKSN